MKKTITVLFLTVLTTVTIASDLYFSSGAVSSYTNVDLTLSGPTNLYVNIERLNRTNDVWEGQGFVTLNTNGVGSFTGSLIEDAYGFFRAKGTNGGTVYYSTNAFGAVVGSLPKNYTLIGNLFGPLPLTNILRDPFDGTQVYRYNNASGIYSVYTYDAGWTTTPPTFDTAEGFFVKNPSTNYMKYIISGLFDTNSISKTIPTGLSIICSPLYHITANGTWRVDTLDTNYVGGTENIPVQTSGYDPQSIIYQQITTAPSYQTNVLTSSNLWQHLGTNVVINLNLTEGFWLDKKGTNSATWTIIRTIW